MVRAVKAKSFKDTVVRWRRGGFSASVEEETTTTEFTEIQLYLDVFTAQNFLETMNDHFPDVPTSVLQPYPQEVRIRQALAKALNS